MGCASFVYHLRSCFKTNALNTSKIVTAWKDAHFHKLFRLQTSNLFKCFIKNNRTIGVFVLIGVFDFREINEFAFSIFLELSDKNGTSKNKKIGILRNGKISVALAYHISDLGVCFIRSNNDFKVKSLDSIYCEINHPAIYTYTSLQ